MHGEKTPLLLVPLLSDEQRKADPASEPIEPETRPPRWHRLLHALVPVVLAIVPDTLLGLLVQYSRDDPGARILTAFTFASIVQAQVVSTLQLVLQHKTEGMRAQLADPLKQRELWVFAQAAWVVYMAYLPFAGLVCGYTAWLSRDAILGQNADVSDVVASLLVINLISLPFSLGSALVFAYLLGYWTPLGFVGIALTDVITYAIQFRMLVPRTHLLAVWPGWHLREALALTPRIACHPAMVAVLLVSLTMMLFGFTSLLAALIKVDVVIDVAQISVFPSLQMLAFSPLFAVCLWGSLRIKAALQSPSDATPPTITPAKLLVLVTLLTATSSACWIVGALHKGESSLPPSVTTMARDALSCLVPVFPLVGFVVAISPVFRTCTELWQRASTVFLVTMAVGATLGASFAENLDGGIHGLWLGQYLGVVVFVLVAALSSRRWTDPGSTTNDADVA